jgi:hypothetical protein
MPDATNFPPSVEHRRRPHIATAEEYFDAFQALPLSDKQWAMLRHHAAAPQNRTTAGELASAAGYPDYGTANLWYGKLAHKVSDFLGLEPDKYVKSGKPFWVSVLAECDEDLIWEMHPEVVEAISKMVGAAGFEPATPRPPV